MSQPERLQIYTAATPTVTRIIPALAKEIGLNESIMLLQIDYWINHCEHLHDDQWWTYQSLRTMQQEAFPYWSVATIQRTVDSLKKQGLILIGNYNTRKGDNTNWFALNKERVGALTSVKFLSPEPKEEKKDDKKRSGVSKRNSLSQNETAHSQNETPLTQNETTLPETTTETTTEIEGEKSAPAENPPVVVPSEETATTPVENAQTPTPSVPPVPPPMSDEEARLIVEAPYSSQRFALSGIITLPIIQAYERALGKGIPVGETQKLAALRAQVAGYTADEAYELTVKKLKEKNGDYPFSWMINDLPTFKKPATVTKQKEVEIVTLTPEEEAAYERNMAELSQKMKQPPRKAAS